MVSVPFRILSLSGGGVRGIFQAVFLKNLENTTGIPIFQQFDLISGTSTGSIIALAVSLGIDINRIIDLYRNKSEEIFRSKAFSLLRKGPRYDQNVLRNEMENIFGTKQLRDTKTNVIVTATCLDQFCHRVFSSFPTNEDGDNQFTAVDVALASSAAPTYFEPVTPQSQERSYVDGGLWANSPSLISILYANRYLNIPVKSMKVLSVGTGDFPQGVLKNHFNNFRTLSAQTIKTIFEIMFSSQQSSADDQTKIFLGPENFFKITAQLNEFIGIDDAKKANEKLPALAEHMAKNIMEDVIRMLKPEVSDVTVTQGENSQDSMLSEFIPQALIEASGLTGFYPSRKFYVYRRDAESIDSYVDRARKSLIMVSINLMTGLPFTNLCKVLEKKLEDKSNEFSAIISLLNPHKADLIFSVSPVLNRNKDQLFSSIKDTIDALLVFRNSLSKTAKIRLELRVHNTIPFGSAIILDQKEIYGRIQIETKPYKAVLNDSFAFEIAPHGTSGFYKTLVDGYELLLKDGNTIEEIDLKHKVAE